MPKAISDLSRSELHKAIERAEAKHTHSVTAMINVGRGGETFLKTKALAEAGGDPLAEAFMATFRPLYDLYDEQAARRRYHGSDKRIVQRR